MVNNKWLSRHPCFISYLKINAFTISSVNVMLAVGFFEGSGVGGITPYQIKEGLFCSQIAKGI